MARNARSAVRQWSVRPLGGDAAWSRIEHTTRHTAIRDTPDYDSISRSQGGCYVPLVCYRGGAYRKARQSGQVLTTTVRRFTLCQRADYQGVEKWTIPQGRDVLEPPYSEYVVVEARDTGDGDRLFLPK